MNFQLKYFLLTLVGAFLLAAAYLYLKDVFYAKRTGKPASERLREKARRPLTKGTYFAVIILDSVLVLASIGSMIWEEHGRRMIVPGLYILFAIAHFYSVRKKWRNQNINPSTQESKTIGALN